MLRTILFAALFVSGTAGTALYNRVATSTAAVYLCMSQSSYAYHKTNKCGFYNQCKASRKEVTLQEAKDMGRKACKGCY